MFRYVIIICCCLEIGISFIDFIDKRNVKKNCYICDLKDFDVNNKIILFKFESLRFILFRFNLIMF